MRIMLVSLFLALSLSACGSASLQQLKTTELKADPFHNALATHYREFATELEAAQDIKNAELFAKKGLRAAGGEDVPAEDPAAWTLPPELLPELTSAHDGLEDALGEDTIKAQPEKAALAQYTYDRWLKRAAENGADAEDYRQRFITALTALAPAPQVASDDAITQTHYVILFDWNSYAIDKEANETLKRVYADMLTGYRSVTLNGHADTSGSADYNMELSLKRASSAEAILEDFGALKEALEVFAFGETDPKVKTGDGVKNRANRRVEIFIHR